jgi:hypothetical protein
VGFAQDTLDSFSTGDYTVTRRLKPTRVGGRPVADPSPATLTTGKAFVAKVSGDLLERLPEGLRTREARQILTRDPLEAGAGLYMPDVVSIDGLEWQVERVDDYTAMRGICRAIVTRTT